MNGFNYIYHSYNDDNLKINYQLSPLSVVLPNKIIVINIENKENSDIKTICQNAAIYLTTDYQDINNIFNSSEIGEKTLFNNTITINNEDTSLISGLTCKLWKPKNRNLMIICSVDKNLNIPENSEIKGLFTEAMLDFNGYRIVIIPNITLSFKIRNKTCPFLYEDENIIDIKEDEYFYDINFKIESYNYETLLISNMMMNYISLKNCSKDSSILKCKLEKEAILEQNNNQTYKLYYYDETYGFCEFILISGITFNSNIQKENIYLNITKLLQNNSYFNNYVVYETNATNISNISNIISDYFLLVSDISIKCFFKKSELNNLLLLCNWNYSIQNYLGKINEQISLGNIHIKYNFIILPFENKEIVNIEESNNSVYFVYPPVLDFYRYNSSLIDIILQFPENISNIILNSYPLNCTLSTLSSFPIQKCIVNIEYFNNYENNNYFYIQQGTNESSNSLNNFYELSPLLIKIPKQNEISLVINKENNKEYIEIEKSTKNVVLYFKTNYYDSQDIFNYTDIEKNTLFNSKVIDKNQKEFDAICRLWKSNIHKYSISVICNLNDNFDNSIKYIKLKDFSFEYNNYTFYIISNDYFEIKKIEHEFSFLYMDEQIISIDNSNYLEYYNITFYYELYNNDILFLNGTKDNYLILDDCMHNSNKSLTCKLYPDKLDEIMALNTEFFSLGAINDNYGIYTFDYVLPIVINYTYFPEKTTIDVRIVSYIGLKSEYRVPFGFTTNIDNIPNLIKEKFNDIYYFRKSTGISLLSLCKEYRKSSFILNLKNDTLTNIHWKYNFYIRASISKSFEMVFNASDFRWFYPKYFRLFKGRFIPH